MSDENALKGLPMLLDSVAATWWQGVKGTIATWVAATEGLRRAFGVHKPAYVIFRELFSSEQKNEPTDVFVDKARALLSHLPSEPSLPVKLQLDMIYGLLHPKIRKRVAREDFGDFDRLRELARAVEDSYAEEKRTPIPDDFPRVTKERPRCKYCRFLGHTQSECRKFEKAREPHSRSFAPRPRENGRDRGDTSPGISCYKCGLLGYLSSQCPRCKDSSVRPRDTDVSHVNLLYNELQEGKIMEPRMNRPLLEVTCEGITGLACVDTGARQSVAGERLRRHLVERGHRAIIANMRLVLADGVPREVITHSFRTIIEIANRRIPLSFLSIPDHPEAKTLLGIDFIAAADMIIDVPRMQWRFSDEGQFKRFAEYPVKEVNAEISGIEVLRTDEGAAITNAEDRAKIQKLLADNQDVFRPPAGPTPYAEHRIKLTSDEPVAVPPHRLSPTKREILKIKLEEMLNDGIVEECESPYAAPVVLVQKKTGDFRVCIDYRGLNAITVPDRYPLPRIEDLLHSAVRTSFMSTLDLRSGYWQVAVRESDRDKTAFVTPFGTYRFLRMPFGLRCAGATFQRLMDKFRAGLSTVTILVYLDDIIVLSDTFEKHLSDLAAVFLRLRQFRLHANRDKCMFACNKVKYLGHLITPSGISADPGKVDAIAGMKPPRDLKQLRGFLQTCSWFRRFVPDFAAVAKPLTDLTKKDISWIWTEAQDAAFKRLKEALVTAPILRQADPTLPYILRTDASAYAIGACLLQGEGQEERPVEYASRLLTKAESNYSTTEREALAVVYAVKKFRGYVDGCPIRIATDHQPLRWLMSLKAPSGRLARWALELQEYDLLIEYTPGRCNFLADMLSRPPIEKIDTEACEVSSISITLPTKSPHETREEQQHDPEVKKIMDCLEDPQDAVDFKRWTERGYIMHQGVLYRYGPDNDSDDPQLVIPRGQISEILRECHDSPLAGHYGADRTLSTIARRYYWTTMRRDVAQHVRKCLECNRYKPNNMKPAGLIQTPPLSQRFEVISIDLFGPLPRTSDGLKWVFVVEDVATKWTELFGLSAATAVACARILIDEIILRYGTPRRVISDNALQFVSAVMQQVASVLGFQQTLIPVYHPEANPAERKNRDLKVRLAIMVEEQQSEWANALPAIRFAMNTAKNSSTGFSPAMLCFGREIRSPGEVQRDLRTIVENEHFATEITPYLRLIATNMQCAKENHELAQDRAKRYGDLRRSRAEVFTVGDKVWVESHPISDATKGFSAKLAPKRDGPYVIASQLTPSTYRIASVQHPRDIVGHYHSSALRKCHLSDQQADVLLPVHPLRRTGRPKGSITKNGPYNMTTHDRN